MHVRFPGCAAGRPPRGTGSAYNGLRIPGAALAVLCASLAHGQVGQSSTNSELQRYSNMSLEQLMQEPVTIVSKREQTVAQTAAAVYVITPEDIQRSGALTIPDALRIVPGLVVAQIDSSKWAISSRGFNDELGNKLLVLVDGRTVYDALFSGVWWDATDYVLEDIERIEVIRGPGGSVWGANAVNGVINIVTKSSADTTGGLVTAVGGNQEASGAIRYGGALGSNATYRAYVKYFDRDSFVYANGHEADDKWDMFRTGMRTDWRPWEKNVITVSGDYYRGFAGYVFQRPIAVAPYTLATTQDRRLVGGDVLARWTHTFSDTADVSLQTYYDRIERHSSDLTENRDTIDVELQNHFKLWSRNDVTWGVNARRTYDETTGSYFSSLVPPNATKNLVGVFLQDDLWIVEDKLRLTLGSKVEHNDYTGYEVQPNGRLLWTPDERSSFWGSVSRAVHTPDRVAHDLVSHITGAPLPGGGAFMVGTKGNPDIDAEHVLAYELGCRLQPTKKVFFDIAVFYNEYDDVIIPVDKSLHFDNTTIFDDLVFDNKAEGHTYGVELGPTWRVTSDWQLSAGYSFIEMDIDAHGRATTLPININTRSPEQQFNIRSHLTLPAHLSFDTSVYYVDQVHPILAKIPSYVRWDVRVAWDPTPNLQLSVGAANLLDDRHPEFASYQTRWTESVRSFYAKATWRF